MGKSGTIYIFTMNAYTYFPLKYFPLRCRYGAVSGKVANLQLFICMPMAGVVTTNEEMAAKAAASADVRTQGGIYRAVFTEIGTETGTVADLARKKHRRVQRKGDKGQNPAQPKNTANFKYLRPGFFIKVYLLGKCLITQVVEIGAA